MTRGGQRFPALTPPNDGCVCCAKCPAYCVLIQWTSSVQLDEYCESGTVGEPSWSWGPTSNDPECIGFSGVSVCGTDDGWVVCSVSDSTIVLQRFMFLLIETDRQFYCDNDDAAKDEWEEAHGLSYGSLSAPNGAPDPGYPPDELIQSAWDSHYGGDWPDYCP